MRLFTRICVYFLVTAIFLFGGLSAMGYAYGIHTACEGLNMFRREVLHIQKGGITPFCISGTRTSKSGIVIDGPASNDKEIVDNHNHISYEQSNPG